MIELFHISDLHIGRMLEFDFTKKTKMLLDKMEAKFDILTSKNKYLLITGDISDKGTESLYKKALGLLSPYKGKIFFVPGNHDYSDKFPTGFFYSEKNAKNFDDIFAASLDPKQVYFNRLPFKQLLSDKEKRETEVLLIGLNSCIKLTGAKSPGATFGFIGYNQMTELNKILKDPVYKNIPKLVYLHHIPYKPAEGLQMNLIDWNELMPVLENRVDILAFGHEGSMQDIKNKTLKEKVLASRSMRSRKSSEWGIDHILDANNSISAQACYHIKIQNREIETPKVTP